MAARCHLFRLNDVYTIIDSDNYAAHGIETMFFPGGEPHVKVPASLSGNVVAFLKLRTWSDVGIAACVIDALNLHDNIDTVRIFIPYFPGARQDKVKRSSDSDPYSSLTIAMTGVLLTGGVQTIVFDLHSEEAFEWLSESINLMPKDLPLEIKPDVVGIIAPDEGAAVRAESFRSKFYPTATLVQCSKRRDPTTGRLSGYEMPSLSTSGRYVIVDDICDGGGTFNLLADAFFHDPIGYSSKLEMFVSHGIFSKGLDAIDSRIERITTTDSWCMLLPSQRLTVVPLKLLFDEIMENACA
jgi:ribose-phosphate pyrophosphokinase